MTKSQTSLLQFLTERRKNSSDLWHLKPKLVEEISRLYDTIEGWLDEAVKEGFVKIRRRNAEICDEALGLYSTFSLHLYFGCTRENWLEIEPIGFDANGDGRVDIKGDDTQRISLFFIDGKWKLESPTCRFFAFALKKEVKVLEDLDESRFEQVIMNLLRGEWDR